MGEKSEVCRKKECVLPVGGGRFAGTVLKEEKNSCSFLVQSEKVFKAVQCIIQDPHYPN